MRVYKSLWNRKLKNGAWLSICINTPYLFAFTLDYVPYGREGRGLPDWHFAFLGLSVRYSFLPF
jgi:hypothetical protein